MNIIIISQKRDLSSITSRNSIFFNRSLDCSTHDCKVSTINCWLWNVKDEDIRRCHWRSAHVILSCKEINWTILQLFSRIKIVSNSLNTQRRVIVWVYSVLSMTKVADPELASTNESYEGVYIGSTVLASNYWIWAKGNRGHRLVILKEINNDLRSMGRQNNWLILRLEFHILFKVSLYKELY